MEDTGVVISGISGLFPQDYNLQQFKNSILANACLVEKSNRFQAEKLQMETYMGEISFKHFDHLFHGINRTVSYWGDPTHKLAFERGFEAMMDAGINPDRLSGTRTNVYYTTGFSEFNARSIDLMRRDTGYLMMAGNAAMGANRFSFIYNFKGHSVAIEANGSAFLKALENAVDDISSGGCEAAVLIGATVTRSSKVTLQLKELGLLSPDQTTRSFDENGQGAPRSEGSVALFLQRADAAKRCYATVLDSSAGMVPGQARGQLMIPSPDGMADFLRAAYQRAGRDPADLAYLEADGLGVPLRDEMELLAHERALLEQQQKQRPPLLVGSVKSNVGNMSSVNGGVAICKAVVAMETGVIPATINCTTPNSRVPALRDGRMQVVTGNTPLEITEKTIMGITSFGIACDVGHAILKPNLKEKKQVDESNELPRLVILAGRNQEAVERTLQKFQTYQFDIEFIRLVQDIYSSPIRGCEYRAVTISPPLPNDTAVVKKMERRTMWFVFSGMGSQWVGMGADLMQLPLFRDTIQRLHDILLPKGLDLKRILTDTDENIFDDILHSFVAITASQIALTNIMKALDLVPDGIIGHSVGELACAYADGCLTEEQTILAAWARGRASNEATLIKGMMAAVGVGHADIVSRLPPSIEVACRNSSSSCTLSGPADDVEAFVARLQDEGVFARSVNVGGIAYHSRYIQPAAPLLRRYLADVIPEPRPRSSRWVSTSVPTSRWDRPEAQFCSVEYLTNNLLSPVLFEEGLRFVPGSALLVEVAPHGLLQAILKRAMPDAQHEPLTRRGAPSQLRHLLTAIGRTCLAGVYPVVSALYPDVSFPVSRGTPSISPLIQWDHSEILTYDEQVSDCHKSTEICELNSDSPFMKAHDSCLYPLSYMLIQVWKCLAAVREQPIDGFGVVFEDVYVGRYAKLPSEGSIELIASLMTATGNFELAIASGSRFGSDEVNQRIAWGRIRVKTDNDRLDKVLPESDLSDVNAVMSEEVLHELKARGLQYSNNLSAPWEIHITAKDWFVELQKGASLQCVLEGLLQSAVLRVVGDAESLLLPNHIQKLVVEPSRVLCCNGLVARYHLASGIMEGPGLHLSGLKTTDYRNVIAAPASDAFNASVLRLQFAYLRETEFKSAEELVSMAAQLASERSPYQLLMLLELPRGEKWSHLLQKVHIQTAVERLELPAESLSLPVASDRWNVLAACGPGELSSAARVLARKGGLLLASGPSVGAEARSLGLCELARCRQGALLCQPRPLSSFVKVVQLDASQPPPPSLPHREAVLVWRGISTRAASSAVTEALSNGYASRVRLVFILDDGAPLFSLSDPLYATQLQLNLFINILQGGRWGSWKQLPEVHDLSKIPDLCSAAGAKVKAVSFPVLGSVVAIRKLALWRPVNLAMQGEMTLGWLLPGSSLPQADPVLRWGIPSGWSSDCAVSVPWAYAMAYLALEEIGRVRKGESLLILDAASPIGQAAVRVAVQIGCYPIFTTVTSESERSFVKGLCSEVHCAVMPYDPQGLSPWVRRATRGSGADVVLGAPSVRVMPFVLDVVAENGRFIHTAPQVFGPAATIGLGIFKLKIVFYGVTGEQLLHGSSQLRQSVANAVREGIEKGHVQPIVTSDWINNESRTRSQSTDGLPYIRDLLPGSCSPSKLYIIAGGDGHEWPAVAELLWRRGARHVRSAGGGAASRRRLDALRRLGLHVQHDQAPRSATSPVAAVVAILKDGEAPEEAATAWQQCCSTDTLQPPLLLLRRSQLLQLPALLRAARPGVTLLPAPPAAVTSTTGVARCCELPVSCWLPRSLAALSYLGSRYPPQTCELAVRIRGVPGALSRLNHCGEAPPLLALPPLGALHDADASEALSALGARLVCPLLCVESKPNPNLQDHAFDIVKAVLRLQWAGPLGVLGWGPSVPLALELTRQLEAAGRTVVAFLLSGDPSQLRLGAAALSPLDIVTEATAKDSAAQQALQELPADSDWPGVVSAVRALPGVARDVTAGLDGIRVALHAIRDHRPPQSVVCRGRLHFMAVGSPTGFNSADPCLYMHYLPRVEVAAGLRSARVAQVINEHSAWPRLASDQEVRKQLQLQSSRQMTSPAHQLN